MSSATVIEPGTKEADVVLRQVEEELNPPSPKGKAGSKSLPPVVSPEKQAEIDQRNADLEKLEAARNDASHAVGSFETGTAISVYCTIGELCWNALYLKYMMHGKNCGARGVPNSWTDRDYDNEMNVLRTRTETLYPHLFLSGQDDKRDGVVAKVSNYVLASRVVRVLFDSFGHMADEINGLSYHAVVNLIGRKCVVFSKTAMECSLKPSWAEFLKVNIPKLYIGVADGAKGINYKDFAALAKEHEGKLSTARKDESKAGKTPAQLAQEQKEAEARKKSADASEKENRIRTDLCTSLSVALAGGLKPQAIAGIIEQSAKDANLSMDVLKLAPTPAPAFDPATCTVKEVLAVLKAMYAKDRYEDIRTISRHLNKLVATLDIETSAPSTEANAA